MRAKTFTILFPILGIALLFGCPRSLNAQHSQDCRTITVHEDRPDLNFVGQFISPATGSDQYGYLSKIEGIGDVFNSATVSRWRLT